MLPVFIKKNIDTDFNRIEGVLRYLVYDIDYPFEKIDFNFTKKEKQKLSGQNLSGQNYSGENKMKAILLDLLKGGKYSIWKFKDFVNILRNNEIHHRDKYNEFIKKREELNLPEYPTRSFPDFIWEQTYNQSPYYSKKECKEVIKKILDDDDNIDLDNEEEPEIFLNGIDSKIPPYSLFTFYGGNNNLEYY